MAKQIKFNHLPRRKKPNYIKFLVLIIVLLLVVFFYKNAENWLIKLL